jgi:hypothetical protein
MRRAAAALAALACNPAFAHLTGTTQAHAHAGDAWGVAVVLALTVGAACIDRRWLAKVAA